MVATALISALTLAVVAASVDGGGRTVASHVTSALACSWRAASPRRDACTVILIHDAGTPSMVARSAASAAMTASIAAVPTAAAGTFTVSVRMTTMTAVADELADTDVDDEREVLDDSIPAGEAASLTLTDGVTVALVATLALASGSGESVAKALADADALEERRRMATLRLVMVAARTPASAGES